MSSNALMKTGLIFLISLLAVDVGYRLSGRVDEVSARGNVRYKVVSNVDWIMPESTQEAGTEESRLEKLLNRMAEEGWVFDHENVNYGFLVFRK